MAKGTLDGAIPDIQVSYAGASGADHTETIDYDTIFGNPDKTNCPIILCSLLGAGCGQAITTAYPNFANEVYIDADGKTLKVETKHATGYTYNVCLMCSNGEHIVTNDNLKVT
jgi:hypothetical protein